MLEKEELKPQEGLDEVQIFQRTVSDFLDSIPENGPLVKRIEKVEKREDAVRAISFGELFNQMRTIALGVKNLNTEQKAAIMKRVKALKDEAFFWTQRSDSGRNFEKEVENMARRIWRSK